MSEFGRELCRLKHVEKSKFRNDKKIEVLKALLLLKDDQILVVALKIDTIVRYLKFKDSDEKQCEIDEKIVFHELDEDDEYDEKVEHLVENENDLKIFEEGGSDDFRWPVDYNCHCCEHIHETEIRLLAHFWKDHRGKSTFIAVPRNPPP